MTMNSIRIVPCGLKHQALLSAIGRETFYETFSPFHPESDMKMYLDTTYTPEKIRQNIHDPEVRYYAAYTEEGDAGYIKLISGNRPEGPAGRVLEIEKIYVRRKFQGRKIGSALMEEAVKTAIEKGCDYIFLGVWQENKEAIAFYQRWGFEIYATRTFQLGKRVCEDYLMMLRIPESSKH